MEIKMWFVICARKKIFFSLKFVENNLMEKQSNRELKFNLKVLFKCLLKCLKGDRVE